MSKKKHIATAATYGGLTGNRLGTRYLYSESEITKYLAFLAELGKPAHLRRCKI